MKSLEGHQVQVYPDFEFHLDGCNTFACFFRDEISHILQELDSNRAAYTCGMEVKCCHNAVAFFEPSSMAETYKNLLATVKNM